MNPQECLERLYDSYDGEPLTRVVAGDTEFEGVTVTRSEMPNNQLEVLVGDDGDGQVVQFDVKYSVDGSLMNIEAYRGDPREMVGNVEEVER